MASKEYRTSNSGSRHWERVMHPAQINLIASATSNLDSEQVTRFLKLIDPQAKNFTFQTFEDKKPATNVELARVVQSPAQPILLQLHAHGAGIFLTVNETDG